MSNNPEVTGRIKLEIEGTSATANKLKQVGVEQQRILDATKQQTQQWKGEESASSRAAQQAAAEERKLTREIEATNHALQEKEKFAKSSIAASIDASVKARQAEQSLAGGGAGRGSGASIAGVAQRAAGAVGLGGVSELSGIIDDIGDFTKAIGESGISAGKAALSLGVAGAALAAIGLAVKIFSDNLDKGARVVQQAVNSLSTYYKAIESGTTESIQEQLKAAKAQKEAIDAQIATIENARAKAVSSNDLVGKAAFAVADVMGKLPKTDELTQEATKAQAEIDGLTRALTSSEVAANNAAAAYAAESKAILASVNEQASQTLRQRQAINALEGQSADSLKKRADSLREEIKNTTEYLNTLQSTGEPSEELDRAINQAMLDLQIMTGTLNQIEKSALPAAKANETYKKSLEDATKAADEYAKNARAIKDIEKERAQVLEERARTESRNSQIAALQSQIEAAKAVEAQQTASAKIIAERKKVADEEQASLRKLSEDIAKVNADYMANELKELAAFHKEETRATEDYNRERVRKLQDLYDTLSGLAAKGDVSAFIQAQRAGQRDLQRGAEDFGVQGGRRAQDFVDAQREREQEHAARLKELQDNFVAERAQRQANLREQLAQEAEAGKQRLTRSAQLEKQLADLREQFAKEDIARQRKMEDAAYKDQVKALEDRQKVLAAQIVKVADPVINSAKKLITEAGNALSEAAAKIRAAAMGAAPPRRGGAGGTVAMHATGALYTQPTLQLSSFAELPGMGDAVIPFRQSEGLLPALDRIMQRYGGDGGNVTVNLTTGNIATQVDISSLKADIIEAVKMARSRKGA